jgi:hypothetical protein
VGTGSPDELQALNAAFKADPSVRYVDYLDARKAAMYGGAGSGGGDGERNLPQIR